MNCTSGLASTSRLLDSPLFHAQMGETLISTQSLFEDRKSRITSLETVNLESKIVWEPAPLLKKILYTGSGVVSLLYKSLIKNSAKGALIKNLIVCQIDKDKQGCQCNSPSGGGAFASIFAASSLAVSSLINMRPSMICSLVCTCRYNHHTNSKISEIKVELKRLGF